MNYSYSHELRLKVTKVRKAFVVALVLPVISLNVKGTLVAFSRWDTSHMNR